MAFKGWPASALEFYEGLEADNSKAYWTEHKADYEKAVKAPMDALLADIADEFGEGHLYRPYRDIRFSADKSPYKTNIAAGIGAFGYLHLSVDGLTAGSGMYHMASDQLDRFRRAVADDSTGSHLESIVSGLRAQKIDVHAREALKTAPKGYPRDHPRVDLLKYKGLVAMKQWPAAAWLGTAAAKTRVVEVFRAARPLNDWLDANVGSSALEETGRR
jgi:uncharacterized protein (TIGR02453 family)